MCQIYHESHRLCGHKGDGKVESFCAAKGGVHCYHKVEGPIRTVDSKCTNCLRLEAQAQVLFPDQKEPVDRIKQLLEEVVQKTKH